MILQTLRPDERLINDMISSMLGHNPHLLAVKPYRRHIEYDETISHGWSMHPVAYGSDAQEHRSTGSRHYISSSPNGSSSSG